MASNQTIYLAVLLGIIAAVTVVGVVIIDTPAESGQREEPTGYVGFVMVEEVDSKGDRTVIQFSNLTGEQQEEFLEAIEKQGEPIKYTEPPALRSANEYNSYIRYQGNLYNLVISRP